jgi:hypothetical protein
MLGGSGFFFLQIHLGNNDDAFCFQCAQGSNHGALADRMRRPHKRAEAALRMNHCRYRGFEGMQRWVGLGVIANNIIQIGRCLALQRA